MGPRVPPVPLHAITALVVLVPDIAEFLDAKALVVGVVSCEVAVGLESNGRVAASEHELLEVTHAGGCS